MKKRELRTKEIENKLKYIVDTVNILYTNLPSTLSEFRNLGLVKDGLYKKAEYAIQNILDICSIINMDLGLGIPETEDSIFDNLDQKKIFDKKVVNLIREMKGFRNVLVHRYGEVDDIRAFTTLQDGAKDFETVIAAIEKFLEKQ